MTAKKEVEEGPRSYSRFLEMLDDGTAHATVSEDLHELTKTIRDEALARHGSASGTITVVINLKCDEVGTVEATYESKTKLPKRKSSKTIVWLTKSGNITPENPRQQKLPLREVPGGRSDVRDVDGDQPAVREV